MAERIAAGFRYLFYGVVDSDGKFIGSTATAPAAGDQSGSGMARLAGARTLPVAVPEPEIVVVSGDDQPLVTFEFDAEALPSGIFEMAVRNTAYDNLIQSTTAFTIGDTTNTVLNPRDRDSQSMCFLMNRRAKKWEAGVQGAKAWEVLTIPRATSKALFAEITQRTFNPYRYGIYLDMSDRTLWSTIREADWGTTAGAMFLTDADNPMHIQRFTGDNSEQDFTLDFPPVSGAKTYVYVNDIKQTVTTNYTVSGNVLSFVAAPGTSAVIVAFYEVAEADLS